MRQLILHWQDLPQGGRKRKATDQLIPAKTRTYLQTLQRQEQDSDQPFPGQASHESGQKTGR